MKVMDTSSQTGVPLNMLRIDSAQTRTKTLGCLCCEVAWLTSIRHFFESLLCFALQWQFAIGPLEQHLIFKWLMCFSLLKGLKSATCQRLAYFLDMLMSYLYPCSEPRTTTASNSNICVECTCFAATAGDWLIAADAAIYSYFITPHHRKGPYGQLHLVDKVGSITEIDEKTYQKGLLGETCENYQLVGELCQ